MYKVRVTEKTDDDGDEDNDDDLSINQYPTSTATLTIVSSISVLSDNSFNFEKNV